MSDSKQTNTKMEDIISLCKRRGFVYQGSEIYGGLAGTWDYAHYGLALKNNIKNIWWKMFVTDREDVYGIDAAILMNGKVWEASGHVGGFSDPLIEDTKTKKRYRLDHVLEENGVNPAGLTVEEMGKIVAEKKILSPDKNPLAHPQQFNMMFSTKIGASEDTAATSYLRPETAQGIFVNYKNVIDSFHPTLPFGIAQIGKAFRNEITPRDFIFRVRELEQMEIEYFIEEKDWEKFFSYWEGERMRFCEALGLPKSMIHVREHDKAELSHYSRRTNDIEFDFPFGQKELFGLAYRTDFDLKAHSEKSKVDLSFYDEEKKTRFTPHVIEPTFGVDRSVLAVLVAAYTEDEMSGEKRVYLKLSPNVAPVKVAVFPLLKNKPELVKKAREVYTVLKKEFGAVEFDDNGNIGKRYRRQDEIGTPYCITVDFDTLSDNTVTVRDRDSGTQKRISIDSIKDLPGLSGISQ